MPTNKPKSKASPGGTWQNQRKWTPKGKGATYTHNPNLYSIPEDGTWRATDSSSQQFSKWTTAGQQLIKGAVAGWLFPTEQRASASTGSEHGNVPVPEGKGSEHGNVHSQGLGRSKGKGTGSKNPEGRGKGSQKRNDPTPPDEAPDEAHPKPKKKTRRGVAHARKPEADTRRTERRAAVEHERVTRLCQCPPYAPHIAGCSEKIHPETELLISQQMDEPQLEPLLWQGDGDNVLGEYVHKTDAWIERKDISTECFVSEEMYNAFIKQARDERPGKHHGQMVVKPILSQVFETSMAENYQKAGWKRHLPAVYEIVKDLTERGLFNTIKRSGQAGECIHDYGVTEINRRSGNMVPHFNATGNDTYAHLLTTCQQDIQHKVEYEWARGMRCLGKPSKIEEAKGDFFEFVEFYLLANCYNDHLMQMITNTVRIDYGDETMKKAIQWEHDASSQKERHECMGRRDCQKRTRTSNEELQDPVQHPVQQST